MLKKYIVRLTDEERAELQAVVRKLKGSSQKVRRAQILLKADAVGPAWTDAKIAEAFDCRTRTVEMLRERLVTNGFAEALHGKVRAEPATEKLLSGEQEAKVIALRLGPFHLEPHKSTYLRQLCPFRDGTGMSKPVLRNGSLEQSRN